MKLLLTTIDNDCIHSKLALKYLYGVIADSPADVEVIEFKESDADEDIFDEIIYGRYDVVYFHCNMMNEERIDQLCDLVKKARPTSITMVGGMQVSFDTGKYMQRNPGVDFVIRGEGEHVMFNFVRTIVTYDFDFSDIAGLAYRENGEIHVNPYEAPVRFEDIPFPYERFEVGQDDTVYYESFRGSVDRCAYSQFLPDRKVRALSLNRVCTELRYFIVKNVKEVRFIEKWFNYNPERAFRIWDYLIDNDNGVTTFRFDIDGDQLDDETIRLLSTARKGMFEFDVCLESTNAEALDSVGRKANIYQSMYNVSRLIQAETVKVNVYLRAGLPFDTPKLFARSFNKIYGLGADGFHLEILRLRKGTLLRANAKKFGYLYSNKAPYEIISNDFMNSSDVIRIRLISKLVDIFVTSGDFTESVNKIMNDLRIKPYDFFKELADFIIENDLKGRMDRKANLYRILYAFATNVYDSESQTLQLPILMEVIHSDLEKALPYDEVTRFDKKGWDIEPKKKISNRY